ncbi:MAG: transglutaminase-like domain-containing protein [Pseudoclavibacter sp.]|nr:transglutaminase-like domain-containing protein [Pseudoclavibacter sp.]
MTAPGAGAARPGPLRGRRAWIALGFLWLLLLPGVFAHEPVFGDGSGLRAAAGGALLGSALALLGGLLRWRWWTLWGAAVLVYLAFGGALALPSTTVAGLLPTAQSWQLLLVQLVHAWKDLLTLVPPAAAFTGPTVLPYATGLLAALLAGRAAFARRRLLAIAPPALWYGIGAAWSVPYAPHALWWGLLFVTAAAVWAVVSAAWEQRDAGETVVAGDAARAAQEREGSMLAVTDTRVRSQRRRRRVARSPWRRAAGVAGTIGLGVLIAALAVPLWAQARPRTVLREYVAPPLRVHDLPTPLEQFRHLSADLADDEVLRVSGLPEGARVRFAAVNEYDGLRWGVATPNGEDAGFVQIGRTVAPPLSMPPGSVRYTADLVLQQPIAGWIPGVGRVQEVDIGDPRVAGAMFYDGDLRTGLSTVSAPSGMPYRLSGWSEPVWSEPQLTGLPLGTAAVPEPARVPESLSGLASSTTSGAVTPLDRLRALERYFRDSGFFANGLEYPSRPGHGVGRIAELIDGEQMIGDDEQYATAMALAAISLGMPARVVMGAYPEEYGAGELVLRGSDVHVWVEVQFEGVGWVPFDPTPPKDQTPQTEVPEPQSVPQPQVLQPPEPPQEPPRLPADRRDDERDEAYQAPFRFPWLQAVGGLVIALLVFVPLLGVPMWKRRRRRRRQRAQGREGIRSAWREAQDYALDAGLEMPERATLLETAEIFEGHRELGGSAVAFARLVASAEFSGRLVSEADVRSAWEAEGVLRAGLRPPGRWPRHRVRMSWRSLPLSARLVALLGRIRRTFADARRRLVVRIGPRAGRGVFG